MRGHDCTAARQHGGVERADEHEMSLLYNLFGHN